MVAKKDQRPKHIFLKDLESINVNYKIDMNLFLLDLKVLIKEYYAATLTEQADALTVQFNNGQTFILSAKEV